MLLQQIVELFDEELERLQQLRTIVAGLAGPSILEEREQNAPVREEALAPKRDAVHNATEPATRRKKEPARERKVADRRAKAPHEPNALQGTIPKVPVVVSAEALAREKGRAVRAPRETSTPPPQPGTLGSMIRALRLEATS